MNDFDIPIFKHCYDLYKEIHRTRSQILKQDRFTLWQKVENTHLEVLEGIMQASSVGKSEKLLVLVSVSNKLNLLRIMIRLSKDTRIIDIKRYDSFQNSLDEIGRMLGGWIKQVKE